MARNKHIGKSLPKALNVKEQLFVDCYCGPANYNGKKAFEMVLAKEQPSSFWHQLTANQLLKMPHIQEAIKKHQEKLSKKFNIQEIDILERLWVEANREGQGANHNARITALVWLGKHFGMFQDKKQEQGPASITYNIVNYSEAPQKEKVIEEKDVEVQEQEAYQLPSSVVIQSYAISEEENKEDN